MMVFTIAVSCAFWYYGINRNALFKAYKWMITKHLGSLAFAAAVIAGVTFIRMLLDRGKKSAPNKCISYCLCICVFILKQIEALITILNHNSVIVMAVTGESYIESAKTTIGLLS